MFVNLTDSQQAVPHLEIKDKGKGEEKKLPILHCPFFWVMLHEWLSELCHVFQCAEELITMYDDDSAARAALE